MVTHPVNRPSMKTMNLKVDENLTTNLRYYIKFIVLFSENKICSFIFHYEYLCAIHIVICYYWSMSKLLNKLFLCISSTSVYPSVHTFFWNTTWKFSFKRLTIPQFNTSIMAAISILVLYVSSPDQSHESLCHGTTFKRLLFKNHQANFKQTW